MNSELRNQILRRDEGLCPCGEVAEEVHHIVPRSHTSKKHKPEWLDDPKNLISLCSPCHYIGGKWHTFQGRRILLRYMRIRSKKNDWGYDYSEAPFVEYF